MLRVLKNKEANSSSSEPGTQHTLQQHTATHKQQHTTFHAPCARRASRSRPFRMVGVEGMAAEKMLDDSAEVLLCGVQETEPVSKYLLHLTLLKRLRKLL